MRMIKAVNVLVMLVLIAVAAGADEKKPHPPITSGTTLPAIELSHQPLEKVLNEIKAKLPGFDFSLSRENVPLDYPVFPNMSLENVTLGQFADIIREEIPGVAITISGSMDSVFYGIMVKPSPNPDVPPQVVRVFGLTDIIAYRASLLKGDSDHEKQATDDILSLIQAALDEADSSVKPQMKIHAPTQTLICKATRDQAVVIEQVLQALKPTEAQQRQMEETQRAAIAEEQERHVLQEVEKINREAATTQAVTPATKPSK